MWVFLSLLGLILLPELLGRLHLEYRPSKTSVLVLKYRYFSVFNIVIVMSLVSLCCFYRPGLFYPLLGGYSFSKAYLFGVALLMFSLFSLYAIFQQGMLSIVPAVVGVIASIMFSLLLIFSWEHVVFFSARTVFSNLCYSLILAVILFRYSCLVGNYYVALGEEGYMRA